MTKVHAIYEKGVFRPTEALQIQDGAEVELTVQETTLPTSAGSVLDALEEISKLPVEGPEDGFSGADHDRILYTSRKSRDWA